MNIFQDGGGGEGRNDTLALTTGIIRDERDFFFLSLLPSAVARALDGRAVIALTPRRFRNSERRVPLHAPFDPGVARAARFSLSLSLGL